MPKPDKPPGKPQPPEPPPEPTSGTLTLNWNANTEPNLAGYKIHCGTLSRTYDTVKTLGTVTNATITLPAGRVYYCALTAFNTANLESGFSNEVSKTIP